MTDYTCDRCGQQADDKVNLMAWSGTGSTVERIDGYHLCRACWRDTDSYMTSSRHKADKGDA